MAGVAHSTEGEKKIIFEYNIILDCTGSDEVVHSIARYDWVNSISLNFTENLPSIGDLIILVG